MEKERLENVLKTELTKDDMKFIRINYLRFYNYPEDYANLSDLVLMDLDKESDPNWVAKPVKEVVDTVPKPIIKKSEDEDAAAEQSVSDNKLLTEGLLNAAVTVTLLTPQFGSVMSRDRMLLDDVAKLVCAFAGRVSAGVDAFDITGMALWYMCVHDISVQRERDLIMDFCIEIFGWVSCHTTENERWYGPALYQILTKSIDCKFEGGAYSVPDQKVLFDTYMSTVSSRKFEPDDSAYADMQSARGWYRSSKCVEYLKSMVTTLNAAQEEFIKDLTDCMDYYIDKLVNGWGDMDSKAKNKEWRWQPRMYGSVRPGMPKHIPRFMSAMFRASFDYWIKDHDNNRTFENYAPYKEHYLLMARVAIPYFLKLDSLPEMKKSLSVGSMFAAAEGK